MTQQAASRRPDSRHTARGQGHIFDKTQHAALLARYIELVSPVLHFMRLKKADSASVLWTRAGEIRHAFSSDLEVNAVESWQVPGIVRICAPWSAARGKASCTSKQLLRASSRPPVYRLTSECTSALRRSLSPPAAADKTRFRSTSAQSRRSNPSRYRRSNAQKSIRSERFRTVLLLRCVRRWRLHRNRRGDRLFLVQLSRVGHGRRVGKRGRVRPAPIAPSARR
jgi:hypothetical protein